MLRARMKGRKVDFDVRVARTYAEGLRNIYLSLGTSFYRETPRTLGTFRINLTADVIEDMRGRDLFRTDATEVSYRHVMEERAKHYPIPAEQKHFLELFSQEALVSGYMSGTSRAEDYFFSCREDGRFCYVKITAVLTRHPRSGEIIAFLSEVEANQERVERALLNKILARQFDMVAYLANGRYGVVAGDASLIERGSIFPRTREGEYEKYLEEQVIPVLSGGEEEKAAMKEALCLSAIKDRVQQKEPYNVNIACDIDGEFYYKRLSFYTVDKEADFLIVLKSDTTEVQRKQIEQNEQLREALADAKQASVAKTAFLSRMSHEIR